APVAVCVDQAGEEELAAVAEHASLWMPSPQRQPVADLGHAIAGDEDGGVREHARFGRAREQVLPSQQQLHGHALPSALDGGVCPHSTVIDPLVNDGWSVSERGWPRGEWPVSGRSAWSPWLHIAGVVSMDSRRLALALWNARSDSARLTRGRRRLAGARAAGHARGRMSEEDVHDPVPAEDADELAGRAVHEDQHDEPELDGPEVRPHDLAPQVAVAL